MTRGELLGESVLASKTLLGRYLKGFGDDNHTRQAANLPNHAAWSLGHLALTMHRTAEKLDGQPLPAGDFVAGSKTGDANRFGTESLGFGSQPVADAKVYPTCARCVAIFETACDRCAAAFANASEAQLDAQVAWGKTAVAAWLLAPRMVFHNGAHCGQIADLRRALGLGSIMG
jgi:hypothetical protein